MPKKIAKKLSVSKKKNRFNDIDIIHLLYLGAVLCETVDEFRKELLTTDSAIAELIFKLRSFHQMLIIRDRFEEAVKTDLHGRMFFEQ